MAKSLSKSTTSPIGGLNARDSLAAMPPQDAVILDNFFPTPTTVDLRLGYSKHVTGITGHVQSLMAYQTPSAGELFAAAEDSIFDVTSAGAVGSAVVTGLTSVRFQHTNIGTPGGQFLYCVNGADKPLLYDGSSWTEIDGTSSPAITGVTTTSLVHVHAYSSRLYFTEKDSFRVWYLPVNSIGGTATELDLSPLFKLGGYMMAVSSWTIDNAAGVQEYILFISSEGEIAMYEGGDPDSASLWNLVGMFRVGRPIGRRCFCRMGSDVILITADGFMPLSKALLTDRAQMADALSAKIVNLVNTDVQTYNANFGWEPILHPIGNKFIINVPTATNSTSKQYVMNTVTGAWCTFSGWNANCFCLFGDTLYFGSSDTATGDEAYVAKCDTGYSDNGALITGEVKTAFDYFGSPGLLKQFHSVRPIFQTAGNITAAIAMDIDFENKPPTSTPAYSNTGGTLWNTGLWNTFTWFGGLEIKKNWQGVRGIGYAGSLHMKVANNATPVKWMAVDYLYETGAIL